MALRIPPGCGAVLFVARARPVKDILRKEPVQGRSRTLLTAILDATARLLPALGEERITTNRVAELAGVSIGSLYQYFPSKDAILARLIERDLDQKEQAFLEVLATHQDRGLDEVVGALIHRAREMFVQDASFLEALFLHAPRLRRLRTIIHHRQRLGVAFAEVMTRYRHEIQIDPPEQALFVLTNAVMGVFQTALFGGLESYDLDALELELRRMVLAYLRAPAAAPRARSNAS